MAPPKKSKKRVVSTILEQLCPGLKLCKNSNVLVVVGSPSSPNNKTDGDDGRDGMDSEPKVEPTGVSEKKHITKTIRGSQSARKKGISDKAREERRKEAAMKKEEAQRMKEIWAEYPRRSPQETFNFAASDSDPDSDAYKPSWWDD